MKIARIYIILSLILFSCEEEIEWDQQAVFPPKLVVEAMITNQIGYNYVKLSLPVIKSGENATSVSNAVVSITSGDSMLLFKEDVTTPGLFVPIDSIRAVVNRIYRLDIVFDNFSFVAYAAMIPVTPLKDFKYFEIPDSSGYYRINPLDSNGPSMIRYTVEYPDSTGAEQKSIFYHYTLSTVDVNQFFKPDQKELFFPKNSRIIREQYSLSPDHEQFIRSLLSETEWKGGWFDVLPGNLHTNLSRGGVGYFAASSLVIDTVYFE